MQKQPIANPQIAQALTHLLDTDQHPEFGALALNLTYTPYAGNAPMATDGTHCFYNPKHIQAWSDAETQFVIAHEALHCAFGHFARRAGRDHQQWNEACDYAINQLLADSHLTPPANLLLDRAYAGLSAEDIYAKRQAAQQAQQPPQQQPQPQQPAQSDDNGDDAQDDSDDDSQQPSDSDDSDDTQDDNQPSDDNSSQQPQDAPSAADAAEQQTQGSLGQPGAGATDVLDPTEPSDDAAGDSTDDDAQPLSEQDWQTITEAAFMATRKAGKLSGDVQRAIDTARQADPDCWEILRQFVEALAPSDYSYARPNRRYISSGLYLPGITKESMPALAIAIDTSGSVTEAMLNEFATHIEAIQQEFQPRAIHVIYCDSSIRHTESFELGDEIKLHAKGGGGTAFQPVFDHIASDEDTYSDTAALIYITDLQNGSEQLGEPVYPVLWAVPRYYRNEQQPFGEKVVLT